MSALGRWVGEWVETLRVAPPFSKRRRELLAVIRESEARDFVEAPHPFEPHIDADDFVAWADDEGVLRAPEDDPR